ncbi:MAG: hypothetical protein P4L40_15720 [Terracidiphilus sp.]|nr:hypothetical protein [Terracidiphilus sp.]
MVVRTQRRAPGVTGLHVGVHNAQRYFTPEVSHVELHLGHLQIVCDLGPDFWKGHPEIHDPRLCAWLESKNLHAPCGSASTLALIPFGKNAFRLMAAPRKSAARMQLASSPAA